MLEVFPFTGDPVLKESLELRIRPLLGFHLVVTLAMIFFPTVNFRLLMDLSSAMNQYDQLLLTMTSFAAVSAVAYGQGLLSLMVFVIVCDVLRKSGSYFHEAVRSQRVKALKVHISTHSGT